MLKHLYIQYTTHGIEDNWVEGYAIGHTIFDRKVQYGSLKYFIVLIPYLWFDV